MDYTELVDEAIRVQATLESAIESAIVKNACLEHRLVQRGISAYLVTEAIDEFVPMAQAIVTGDVSFEDFRLGTEEEYLRWFRIAMRHGYVRNPEGVAYAAKQVQNHIGARNPNFIDSQLALTLGRTKEDRVRRLDEDQEQVRHYSWMSRYLSNHPECATSYLGGIMDSLEETFSNIQHEAKILFTINNLIELDVNDYARFFDAYYERNGKV